LSNIAYPEVNGVVSSVVIIHSADTPKYTNIPGVLINPVISDEVNNAPANHRKIVDSEIVLKTAEEIEEMDVRTPAEKRADAYMVECDPMLTVLSSYEFSNDPKLEALKASWLAKRVAIQELYPDVE